MSLQSEYRFLVAGEWRTSTDLRTLCSPYTGLAVARVYRAQAGDLEDAIAAAAAAHPLTRSLPAYRRAEILRATSRRILEERDHLAEVLALEAGKPIRLGRGEADRAAQTFALAAEEATRIGGELIPLDLTPGCEGWFGTVRRFPIGPIVAITPFNFPLNLVAHKLAPAVAAGCPVVLKPASQTPISALLLAGYLLDAGLPAEALSVVPCDPEAAAKLAMDDRFRMLSFTGSSEVGWRLKSRAGRKKVALELGGNAGVLILPDADLSLAARRCAEAGFAFAGQSCISVQRILLHESIHDRFLEELAAGVAELRVGDPLDEAVTVGPLIREEDAVRSESWIREACSEGAKLHCGGERQGALLSPTILTDVNSSMKVSCREVFAPLVGLSRIGHFSEGLERLNDPEYGLQAGLFTRDAGIIEAAYQSLEVGGLMVNEVPTFRLDAMPYGGVKGSGTGREGPRYAIEAMTEPRLLVQRPLPAL